MKSHMKWYFDLEESNKNQIFYATDVSIFAIAGTGLSLS